VDELLLSTIECPVADRIQTAEPFVPEPSISEVEAAIGKLKRYKSPGADHIPAELIEAGGETLHSEIHKLIKLISNKEELLHQWKGSTVIPIHKKGDKTERSNYPRHIIAANVIQNFIQHPSL
jgi:hypothetical protein